VGNIHVTIDRVDAVAIVRIDRGKTNPINLAVVEQLRGAVSKIREDASTSGMVVGSASEKFFSIGFRPQVRCQLERSAVC
jgi:enoyl-CoA hydratase/carnithine racemase